MSLEGCLYQFVRENSNEVFEGSSLDVQPLYGTVLQHRMANVAAVCQKMHTFGGTFVNFGERLISIRLTSGLVSDVVTKHM